jgi:Arc/MetJ-type ribon-helix-helix transcriptional regulator
MRNRSEVMRKAVRCYLSRVSVDKATPATIAALKRGYTGTKRDPQEGIDKEIASFNTRVRMLIGVL